MGVREEAGSGKGWGAGEGMQKGDERVNGERSGGVKVGEGEEEICHVERSERRGGGRKEEEE